MWKALFCAVGLLMLHAPLAAQTVGAELAAIREDMKLLMQETRSLSLRVEQLERENAALRKQAAGANQSYATLAQLNDAVAELNRTIRASSASTRTETLAQVSTQMEALTRQMNAAIDALNRSQTAQRASTPTTPNFTGNFPQEGISYTVERGDTVSAIAQKTGAKVQDIINANRIVDPTKIRVGEVLFIPGGR